MKSKQNAVLNQVRAMIADGRLAPGERILEADITKAVNVSRSPVRAALMTLCADGVLKKHTGRGFVVPGVQSAAGAPRARFKTGPMQIEPTSRGQLIYPYVERDIAAQVLFRPVRITEEKMAVHFDVSRTVVREVLSQMRATGLVSKDSTGKWRAARITEKRICDLYELRRLLEPEALSLAMPNVSAETIHHQEANLTRLIGTFSTVKASDLDDAEKDFHMKIVADLCPNVEISNVLKRSQLVLITNHHMLDLFIGVPARMSRVFLNEHLAIVNAMKRNAITSAAQLLAAHLAHSKDELIKRLGQLDHLREPTLPAYLSRSGTHR